MFLSRRCAGCSGTEKNWRHRFSTLESMINLHLTKDLSLSWALAIMEITKMLTLGSKRRKQTWSEGKKYSKRSVWRKVWNSKSKWNIWASTTLTVLTARILTLKNGWTLSKKSCPRVAGQSQPLNSQCKNQEPGLAEGLNQHPRCNRPLSVKSLARLWITHRLRTSEL